MKRAFALIIAAATLAACTAGCGDKAEKSGAESTSAVSEVPESVNKELKEAIEADAVPVPDGGWTDDALLAVTLVNGKKLSIPFTLSDLGEGFGVETSGDNFMKKESGETTASLTYYGRICGLLTTPADATADNFASQEYSKLTFYKKVSEAEKYPEVYPISMNGVTIGTKYDDMKARLGFTADESSGDTNTSGKSFTVTGLTDSYYIRIIGKDAEINHITIGPKNTDKS